LSTICVGEGEEMDKQKQVEEMAREIAKRDCYLYGHCPKQPKHNCVSQDPKIMLESSKKYITTAMWLVDAGYRKESDTAKKLAKTIKSVIWEEFENETIRIKDLHGVIDDILNCHYGVTIEN
jgi:hypothetical protein